MQTRTPAEKRRTDFGNFAKPTKNKAEAAKQNQSKPPQTETPAKNLEADFSDLPKPTRSHASAESAVNEKAENLKTCLLKNIDPKYILKRTTAKARNIFYELETVATKK